MNIYNFTLKDIDNNNINMNIFKNKVLLILNTAGMCEFSEQFFELEKIYRKYKDKGFEILVFPCNQFGKQEPYENSEIKNLIEKLLI